MICTEEIFLSKQPASCWFDSLDRPDLPLSSTLIRLGIRGPLDEELFERAFNLLCRSHPVLQSHIHQSAEGRAVLETSNAGGELEFVDLTSGDFRPSYQEWVQSWLQFAFQPESRLSRACIVRLDDNEFVFHLNQHDAITDSYSCTLIVEELSRLYGRLCRGEDFDSDDLPRELLYLEHLFESVRYEDLPSFSADQQYWESRRNPPSPPLQFYGQNTDSKCARTIRVSRKLDHSISRMIVQLGDQVSPPEIFLSVLYAYLNRVTSGDELAVGVVHKSRRQNEEAGLGRFMQICPYRISMGAADTFVNIVEKLRAEQVSVNEHRTRFVPTDIGLCDVLMHFHSSSPGLFAGMPASYELTTPLNILDELDGEAPRWASVSRESLTVHVRNHEEVDYELSFDFNRGVWPDPQIREWAIEHFTILLEGFLRDQSQGIRDICMLTEGEHDLLVPRELSCRQRGETLPTVVQLFHERADLHPNRLAIRCGDTNLTYGELARRMNHLAHLLGAKGVGPGTLVGVCTNRTLNMPVALLSILQAGGAYVPLDPKQPADRTALILEDASPVVILTETALRPLLGGTSSVICLDEPMEAAPVLGRYCGNAGSDDLAYVIFTSGSTGRPKGVEIRHHNLTTLLRAMAVEPGIDPDDCMLSVTTVSFDIFAVELFLPLISGASVTIASSEATIDGLELQRLINEDNVTYFQATPTSYRLLIESGWEGNSNLTLFCGGEALPFDLAQKLLVRCRTLWNLYGPTETTIYSTGHRISDSDQQVYIGKPIAGTQAYVLDENMQPTPTGVPGELYIGGDGVARGYVGNLQLTQEKFVPNQFSNSAGSKLYKTGDLVRKQSDGKLEYLGRLDFQIKIRGFRTEMGEIESVIKRVESVKYCVVNPYTTRAGQKSLAAYVTTEGDSAFDGNAIRSFLRSKLPDYMIPTSIVRLAEFPVTASGKIDRKALPSPDQSGALPGSEQPVRPLSEFELSLSVAWKRVLKLTTVGVSDNFFDLGGDSLMTLPLVKEMKKITGVDFSIGDIFRLPTIEKLAATKGSARQINPSYVIPLQNSENGTALYCLCGLEIYRAMASCFSPGRPVHGVYVDQEQTFLESLANGTIPELSVTKLAKSYHDAILRQQEGKRVYLAGASFGGLLAIESARLLQASGFDVSLVVLIDSILPCGIIRSWKSRVKQSLVQVGRKFSSQVGRFHRRLSTQSSTITTNQTREIAFTRCMESFASEDAPYDGRVLLIKASDKSSWGQGISFAPDYGWGNFIKGPLDVVEIPGSHIEILYKPYVDSLVKEMAVRMEP